MKPLNNSELSAFCDQMGMLLHSGISALEGISILKDSAPTAEGRKILEDVYAKLEMEGYLYLALADSEAFPHYLKDMTEIGEKSGRLDDVMDAMHHYYERQENLSRSIRSAVTYPCIMIAIMTIVILVLILRVMPIFNQVFLQLGTEMTGFSRGILNLGTVLYRYSIFFVALLAVVIALIFWLVNTASGRKVRDRLIEKFFLTRKLSRQIAVGRFADGMSMTISSGLDTEESLEMVSRLTDSASMKKKIANIRSQIEEGASFEEALEQNEVFQGMSARMIKVGTATGHLDEVMKKIADHCDSETEESLNHLVTLLEPSLVAVLSIIVGLILLSVMLPLMGIMSSIG